MKRTKHSLIFTSITSIILLLSSIIFTNTAYAERYYPKEGAGKVSWYGSAHQGKRTANGEVFDMNKLTAASNIIPMGKRVKMTCTTTGKSVVVKINDTGGFSKYGRTFDLSKAAFNAISDVNKGLTHVKYTVLD